MQVQGGGNGLGRHDDDQDDAGEPQLFQPEIKPREPVAYQRTGRHLQQRDQGADPGGVDQRPSEINLLRGDFVILPGQVPGEDGNGGIVQIPFFHHADGEFIQQRMQDQEADGEQQEESVYQEATEALIAVQDSVKATIAAYEVTLEEAKKLKPPFSWLAVHIILSVNHVNS